MGKFSSGMPEQGGGWLKLKEGQNRIRIATDGAVLGEHFIQGGGGGICYGKAKGCKSCIAGLQPTFKKLFWVFDRTKIKLEDGTIKEAGLKLAKLGSVIIKQLDALADNPDYAFDNFPMPYDITIDAKGAGDKGVKYATMPSPKQIPLTEEESKQLAQQRSVTDIVEAMKLKKMKEDGIVTEADKQFDNYNVKNAAGLPEGVDYPEESIDPESIPF